MTIGTKLSTTFKPVSKGILTDVLTIIEGARDSTKRLVFVIIAPFSSIGLLKDQQHDLTKIDLLEQTLNQIYE